MANEEYKLLKFLKGIGIDSITKKEKKVLMDYIKECNGVEMAIKQLELLYSLNQVLIKSYSKVSIANMMSINESIDDALYSELLMTFYKIKQKGLNKQESLAAFKEATLNILANNQSTNLKIQEILGDEFSKLEAIKNVLYLSMLDTSTADKLLENCMRRSKHFLNECDLKNLATLIQTLKEHYSLKEEELVSISNRCATFFALSSAKKLENIEKTVNGFKQFILSKVNGNKAAILLDKSFKDIIVTTPSLLTANPNIINDTIRFLEGASLKELVSNVSEDIANLKGDFTPLQLAKIYSDSLSSLAIGPRKLADVAFNLSRIYKKIYGVDLNLNSFINGRNFSSFAQLRTQDYIIGGKCEEILELLKPFVSEKDMQNLFENNVSFLIVDVDEVKKSLKSAILTSKNQEELKVNILHNIKNHFGRYEEFDKELERNTGIVVDKLKKVGINDIEEDNLIDILRKLDTSQDDLDKWKNSWSNEEKELRELQIQLDLEEILEQLDYIEEVSKSATSNVDDFWVEREIIVDLFQEIVQKHSNIVSNNKFNKKLKALDAEVVLRINEVINSMNADVETIASYYREQLSSLNDSLQEQISLKENHQSSIKTLEDLEKELENMGLDAKTLELQKQKAERLSKIIDDAQKAYTNTNREELKTDEKIGEMYNVFSKYERETSFENPMNASDDELNYRSTYYMMTLLAKILIREELIFPTDAEEILAVNHEKKDVALTYDQYRRLLPDNLRQIADTLYNSYKNVKTTRTQIYQQLLEEMQEMQIDTSNLECIKHCLSRLRKVQLEFHHEIIKNTSLLSKKQRFKEKSMEVDIISVENEINRLNSLIEEYNKMLEKCQKNKINI